MWGTRSHKKIYAYLHILRVLEMFLQRIDCLDIRSTVGSFLVQVLVLDVIFEVSLRGVGIRLRSRGRDHGDIVMRRHLAKLLLLQSWWYGT